MVHDVLRTTLTASDSYPVIPQIDSHKIGQDYAINMPAKSKGKVLSRFINNSRYLLSTGLSFNLER